MPRHRNVDHTHANGCQLPDQDRTGKLAQSPGREADGGGLVCGHAGMTIPPMTAAYFLQLLLISALWGASFPILRVITPELGAAVTALLRISIATATLALLMRARGLRWPWSSWRELTLLGLGAVALPFLLFSFAALKAPAGYLALLNPLAVVFAVLSSAWFKEDTLDAHKIVGCILGFVGLGLVVQLGPVQTAAGRRRQRLRPGRRKSRRAAAPSGTTLSARGGGARSGPGRRRRAPCGSGRRCLARAGHL